MRSFPIFLILSFFIVNQNKITAQCDDYTGISYGFFDGNIICFEGTSFEFTLNTTSGVANDLYFVDVYTTNGAMGNAMWDDGTGNASIDGIDTPGCDPIDIDLIVDVYCDDGSLLESITFPMISYPDLDLVVTPPGCSPGETGSASMVNINTGEICETILGTPGNETNCDDASDGILSWNFAVQEGVVCGNNYAGEITTPCDLTFGCNDPTACNFDPNADCDDGSCVTECCPQPISDNIPRATCSVCPRNLCIEFDSNVSDIVNLQISVPTAFGASNIVLSDNMLCFGFCFNTGGFECQVYNSVITVQYECNSSGQLVTLGYPMRYIGQPIPRPIVTFPDNCQDPVLGFDSDNNLCNYANNLSYEVNPPETNCFGSQTGTITWEIDPSIETFGAECFPLSGIETYTPCSECCPEPITSFPTVLCGQVTEVCIEFDGDIDLISNLVFSGTGISGNQVSTSFNTICFEITIDDNSSCINQNYTLTLDYECLTFAEMESIEIPILYLSDPSDYQPTITYATSNCEDPIVVAPICGTLITADITPAIRDCDNPQNGEIAWTIDPGFDTMNAECFPLSGVLSYPPCFEGCPCSNGTIEIKVSEED